MIVIFKSNEYGDLKPQN